MKQLLAIAAALVLFAMLTTAGLAASQSERHRPAVAELSELDSP